MIIKLSTGTCFQLLTENTQYRGLRLVQLGTTALIRHCLHTHQKNVNRLKKATSLKRALTPIHPAKVLGIIAHNPSHAP